MTTKGEYRVGIDFNPSGDDLVSRIKRAAADLIDMVDGIDASQGTMESCMNVERHDWSRSLRWAEVAAVENARIGSAVGPVQVMWELLKDAARVSALAYPAERIRGYPSRSSLPEMPPDVTAWQMMAAYLRGEIEEMPVSECRPPMPSADRISRADAVLDVWHRHALGRLGDAPRIKRAVYLRACGVAPRKIRSITGIERQALHRARDEAMTDMWQAVRRWL